MTDQVDDTAVLDRAPARPPVDPRLRARRIEVRRNEGRRRLRRLVIALAVTVLCGIAWGVTRSPLLDVDHIEVEGALRVSTESVVAAAGIERGAPLVSVDLDGAREAISGLPWVESAEVSRSWAGTIRYTVVERSPVAVVNDPDGPGWLIDAAGWVLATARTEDLDSLPVIEGLAPPALGGQLDAEHDVVIELAAALPSGLARFVEAIEVDAGNELWLRLVPLSVLAESEAAPEASIDSFERPRVQFGDGRDLAAQIIAAETVLTRVELDCLAVIDVRVGSSPVVTRQQGCPDPE